MKSRRGRSFQAYRGIRYAHAPVGELRFQPPKPMLKYEGVVNATDDGPACPLPAPPDYPVDEDCLTINVYTPTSNSSASLPVIFFIHPGGFYSMTGRSDLAGPHYLLDRDVVLVTINYRLGSLGFLSTGDKIAPGKNGFRDQVVAMQWVQRNIRAFGGDPNLVTIAGCSAGSISVMLHMVSPMSKGLFHRGISMSGSSMSQDPLPDNLYDLAVKQARLVGCPADNSTVIVECLKTKPWRELGDSLRGFRLFAASEDKLSCWSRLHLQLLAIAPIDSISVEWGFDPVGVWPPVVERDLGHQRFLTEQPADTLRRNAAHTTPHLISQTTDEFFWSAYSSYTYHNYFLSLLG
uniref:Carboxylic ester hydrolase n=1 Tax=Chilo suppressalis TaxID=168631 RepID=A0A0B4RY80_CHISP|nr:antennal esterase [Chilo suppressalis]